MGDLGVEIRLTRAELLFLCAGTGVGEVYGIKSNNYPQTKEEIKNEWDNVKTGLKSKEFAEIIGDRVEIKREVAEFIDVIGMPKIFMICNRIKNGVPHPCNYYIARNKAVRLTADPKAPDTYGLKMFSSSKTLKNNLESILAPDIKENNYKKTNARATFNIEKFKEYIQSVIDKDFERHDNILAANKFEFDQIKEIYKLLSERNNISTITVVSIDEKTGNSLNEFVIYGGEKYLWQVDVTNQEVGIYLIEYSQYKEKLEVLSKLMNYM